MEDREIPTVRQNLQRISDELKLLTNVDLVEAKWTTKRKIWTVLFAGVSLLAEQNEELIRLSEGKEVTMKQQRLSNETREMKVETENIYRTRFMREVIKGLALLNWPRAIEAFTDPLDDLLYERNGE